MFPGIFELNFWEIIVGLILVIDRWSLSCAIALRWMSVDLTDDLYKRFVDIVFLDAESIPVIKPWFNHQ